jgi:AraC-like DNA-binding protein
MMRGKDFDRSANGAAAGFASLWHVEDGHALFAGPLHRNALHRHSVPVYLAGIYGSFRLRLDGAEWLSCRTAAIPAGVAYEFDMGGDPLAVFYLEPNVARVDALAGLVRNTREVARAVVGSGGEVSAMRGIYEGRGSRQAVELALEDFAKFSARRAAKSLDLRVARAVEYMQTHYADVAPVADVARSVGLSASRFQHVFTREVGVPFRRYRSWHRLRSSIREIARGSSFTKAAHAAGFADQSHFAREFRRTFGAPASRGLLSARG